MNLFISILTTNFIYNSSLIPPPYPLPSEKFSRIYLLQESQTRAAPRSNIVIFCVLSVLSDKISFKLPKNFHNSSNSYTLKFTLNAEPTRMHYFNLKSYRDIASLVQEFTKIENNLPTDFFQASYEEDFNELFALIGEGDKLASTTILTKEISIELNSKNMKSNSGEKIIYTFQGTQERRDSIINCFSVQIGITGLITGQWIDLYNFDLQAEFLKTYEVLGSIVINENDADLLTKAFES